MRSDLNSVQSFVQKLGHCSTKALRIFPPEFAHNLAGFFLKQRKTLLNVPVAKVVEAFNLKTNMGENFSVQHPIALAAGFDKNAEFLPGLSKLGFSFIEVGAVTPRPQRGHEKPRLFREPEQRALINRMGFNNKGVQTINQSLLSFQKNQSSQNQLLGVNIGPNKETALEKALKDYLDLMNSVTADMAYFSVNLSSPNTASLKSLCRPDFIKEMASHIASDTDRLTKDVWIKLGPNLSQKDFHKIIEAIKENDFAGVILTNTYPIEKPQKGGLSGHPLLIQSTKCLEWAYDVHKGSLPMVGVGGILSGADIFEKLIRGACLIQIYTAFVYRGPFVVYELLLELVEVLKARGFNSVEEARGSFYDA